MVRRGSDRREGHRRGFNFIEAMERAGRSTQVTPALLKVAQDEDGIATLLVIAAHVLHVSELASVTKVIGGPQEPAQVILADSGRVLRIRTSFSFVGEVEQRSLGFGFNAPTTLAFRLPEEA